MKITVSQLRKIVREVVEELPKASCRVCGGSGEVVGEYCAACAGSGEEIDYGSTHSGIGRGPVPWRL